MGIAAGGSIEQNIVRDLYGLDVWHKSATIAFNVHILNAQVFKKVTGLPAPPTPSTSRRIGNLACRSSNSMRRNSPQLPTALSVMSSPSAKLMGLKRRSTKYPLRSLASLEGVVGSLMIPMTSPTQPGRSRSSVVLRRFEQRYARRKSARSQRPRRHLLRNGLFALGPFKPSTYGVGITGENGWKGLEPESTRRCG